MSTIKQKIVLEKIVENGGNISQAMLEVGYSPNTAKTPQKLTGSIGFIELCEEKGLTNNLLINALVEDIKEKKGNRKAELELGFKIKGILNNTKLNITIGTGGYYSQDNIPQKGSDTIVSCTLSGGSKVTLTAFGAYPGNKGDKDNTQIYKSFSNGGKIGKSGNSVDINIINNMNSSFPTII